MSFYYSLCEMALHLHANDIDVLSPTILIIIICYYLNINSLLFLSATFLLESTQARSNLFFHYLKDNDVNNDVDGLWRQRSIIFSLRRTPFPIGSSRSRVMLATCLSTFTSPCVRCLSLWGRGVWEGVFSPSVHPAVACQLLREQTVCDLPLSPSFPILSHRMLATSSAGKTQARAV